MEDHNNSGNLPFFVAIICCTPVNKMFSGVENSCNQMLSHIELHLQYQLLQMRVKVAPKNIVIIRGMVFVAPVEKATAIPRNIVGSLLKNVFGVTMK